MVKPCAAAPDTRGGRCAARAAGYGEGDLCDLTGSFIPLAGTQAQHVANGDPRLSLHERNGSDTGYVAAVTTAANNLVSEGFLLPDDADEHNQ